jgi:Zn-dependent protease
VPFDASRLTRKLRVKVSAALISSAGPISNIILAVVFLVLTCVAVRVMAPNVSERIHLFNLTKFGPQALVEEGLAPAQVLVLGLGGALVQLNILLAAFNLIPLGPLDGAGVLGGFLPDHLQYKYNAWRYHPYTMVALFVLMWVGALRWLLAPTYFLAGIVLNPLVRLVLGV